MFQQEFSNTDNSSYIVHWQRFVLRKDKISVWTIVSICKILYFPIIWLVSYGSVRVVFEVMKHGVIRMSGEPRRPWAMNNFEGVDVTRHNPLDTMWSIGLPPALSRRMFSPLEILSSRKKRFMWGPECISRCLRSGSLHPAQCHQICT